MKVKWKVKCCGYFVFLGLEELLLLVDKNGMDYSFMVELGRLVGGG